jgi:hypothetical protein
MIRDDPGRAGASRTGDDDMNKATRYRLEIFPEGIEPETRIEALKGDGWRLLATPPVHGADGKTGVLHLFERTVEAPIQAFGPEDDLIEWWKHFA